MKIADIVRSLLLSGVVVAAFSACSNGAGSSLPGAMTLARHGSGSSPIQHVVIMIQENRSFDNLFACFEPSACRKYGYEKVNGVDKKVKLKEQHLIPLAKGKPKYLDIGHCYYAFVQAFDQMGKMQNDGFNMEPNGACQRSWTRGKPAGLYPYQYVNPSDIAPYWDMAAQYVLGDAMFQTQGSSSFSAHQDLIRGGTALGGTYGSGPSLIDTPTNYPWGCDVANKYTTTDLITLSLKWEEDKGPFPCSNQFYPYASSDYTTLADLLDGAGVSWKYYSPCYIGTPSSADCPSSEDPQCKGCAGALLNAFDVIYHVRNGPEWGTNVDMPETDIFNDISNGALPAISWVIPNDNNDDHLSEHEDNGPEWVASVVNAIGGSKYWNSTAIVVVWDDWGGLYDHVPPAKLAGYGTTGRDDQGGLGFRVPMIVVSPYARLNQSSQPGYVSHTQYEFGSILKYVENNWGLGSLNTTDARATSIKDVFNYNQTPRTFTVIPTQHDARYFITHRPQLSRGDPD